MIPIENRTGDSALAPVAALATDWLEQSMLQTGLVRVGVPPRESSSGDRNARWLRLVGAVYHQRDSLRFVARVEDPVEGRVLRVVGPIPGAEHDPIPAVRSLGESVMIALATLADARLQRWARASQPPSYQAYREYLAGIELFERGEHRRALPLLLRAAGADSAYVHALVAAAVSRMALGELAAADSLAQAIDRMNRSLTPVDRADVDWLLAVSRGDRYAAWQAARISGALAPGTYAHVQAGIEALLANHVEDAVATLGTIDPVRTGLGRWIHYWDAWTSALHLAGDHARELAEARAGVEQMPGSAAALAFELRALAALGLVDSVERRLAHLKTLPRSGGPDAWRRDALGSDRVASSWAWAASPLTRSANARVVCDPWA